MIAVESLEEENKTVTILLKKNEINARYFTCREKMQQFLYYYYYFFLATSKTINIFSQ